MLKSHYRGHKIALWHNLIDQLQSSEDDSDYDMYREFEDDEDNLFSGKYMCQSQDTFCRETCLLLASRYIIFSHALQSSKGLTWMEWFCKYYFNALFSLCFLQLLPYCYQISCEVFFCNTVNIKRAVKSPEYNYWRKGIRNWKCCWLSGGVIGRLPGMGWAVRENWRQVCKRHFYLPILQHCRTDHYWNFTC